MSFFAVKFTSTYSWLLWLFVALLEIGWAQNVSNNSQTDDNIHASLIPEHMRFRRALPNWVASPCLTPSQPDNGKYKLEQYFCDDIADCEVAEGTSLEPGSQLVYRCNPGYTAEGSTDVYCRAKGKWSAIPKCIEVKCESLNSVSTMVSCTRFGKWLNCDSPPPPETRAEITCRHGYKKDTEFVTSRRGVVTCDGNGRWQPRPIRCVPVCGVAITHQQPFVHGGTPAKIGDFPWHASLFVETNSPKGKNKLFLCGATIIQTNLVMTAAHCVYDERTRRTENPAKLFVITGNVFRDYDSPAHNLDIVRKAAVKNVHTYCNYYGLTGNYVSDIAVLELQQPFEFSSILLPACLDDSGYSDQFLEPGVYGRVAGFGRTGTSPTSGVLQTLTVPYISYGECKNSKNAHQNQAFISSDKFCAGYSNGSSVCEGDSGGGLVFMKGDLWYVMGIVSVGLGVDIDNGERTCDKYAYSLYTKVSIYMMWIQDVLSHVDRNQKYPSCSHESPKPTPTTETVTPGPTIEPSTPPSAESCMVPPQPVNGVWKLHRNFCPGPTDCSIPDGTALGLGSQLVYRCSPEFAMKGNATVVCNTDGKWTPVPSCAGDPCILTKGSSGSCTLLKNCQPVLEELKAGKAPDGQCGFSGKDPIVCCPMDIHMPNIPPQLGVDDDVGDGRGDIAKQKCTEYSQYVKDSKCPLPLAIENEQPANVGSGLGKIKAGLKEFPHMVAVGFEAENDTIGWHCGGTLISETFVLTVAACTFSRSYGSAKWVRVGDSNLVRSDDGAMPEERRIIEHIQHPEYRPPLVYHNIALLRLETRVPFNDWIRPACLHTAPSAGTKVATATGWGRLDWAGDSSDDLMKVVLPLVDLQTCEAKWTSSTADRKLPRGIVGDWLICAGAQGKDTCQGDSGGPLVVPSKKKQCMYNVIGITSFGKACGTGTPGLYTRVYNYIPWIESIVWKQG